MNLITMPEKVIVCLETRSYLTGALGEDQREKKILQKTPQRSGTLAIEKCLYKIFTRFLQDFYYGIDTYSCT